MRLWLFKKENSVVGNVSRRYLSMASRSIKMIGVKWSLFDIRSKLGVPSICCTDLSSDRRKELRVILAYAVKQTAYYSAFRADMPLSGFPIMNKTILNENYDNILARKYRNRKTHKMYTSGSTGIPFTVVQNMGKRYRHIADLKYFGTMAGYRDHDPMCYLRAKPTATQKEQREQNIWQLDICNLNKENLTEYFKVMVEKKCTALIAYPSTLETAVTFWAETFRNESKIKTIISTSEALTSKTRNKLKNYFGSSCAVVARYSNTENGILGQEKGQEGAYVLNWASYYFELLKLDSDEPAAPGELGRIIVTDLYNRAFPMIRYDTGDVAKFIRPQTGLPYLAELYGRRMDLIYDTKHAVVSPFLLCRTMRLSHGIEQWQFIQDGPTDYTLKISVTNGGKPSCDKEVESFLQVLGKGATVSVEYCNDIPVMSSMKRKLIVSHLSAHV